MSLDAPIWLGLLIPSALLLAHLRPPGRTLPVLRGAMLGCLILALAAPVLHTVEPGGTVVVLVDRSLSMPEGSERQAREAIARLEADRPRADRLAVVSFAETTALEPGTDELAAVVGAHGSNLAAALRLGLVQVPAGDAGRLYVLSDGLATGEDPVPPAVAASLRGIPIDYLRMRRPDAGDVAIARLEGPAHVAAGEAFMLTAWIRSGAPRNVAYELRREGGGASTVIARGTRTLDSGLSPLLFRDRPGRAGTLDYRLSVSSSESDPVPANDRARLLVAARDRPRLLHLGSGTSGLVRTIEQAGIEVTHGSGEDVTLERLAGFAAVLLEDVPASAIGAPGLAALAGWVQSGAGGLVMTGGRSSFATGGYYRSPIDPILPVSMELRREHRKLSLAMVIALDRSGSMAAAVSGGRTKMDLADLAAAEVVTLLTPMDQLGVLAVDSAPHVVVPLAPLDDPEGVRRRILSIASMGGGIFVYEALAASAELLAKAESGTRHIILFADAADAEEPGQYQQLLEKCAGAGITVSVVGLGSEGDSDAALLKDVAARGNGNVYFTSDPHELPRIFAQDTFIVAKTTLVEAETPLAPSAGLLALLGTGLPTPPSIGGYNLCYARPGALVGLVSVDENAAPIVAAWHVGAGRAACYLGEADGTLTGAMATYPQAADLFAGLCRFTMASDRTLPRSLLVTQEIDRGMQRIRLHVDPDLPLEERPRTVRASIARRDAGGRVTILDEPLAAVAPDTFALDLPLGTDVSLATVHAGDARQVLAPAVLPYSPEAAPEEPGTDVLVAIAAASRGVERLRPSTIWDDMPLRETRVELAPLLSILAALLLFTEVLERRTALVSWVAARALAVRRRAPVPKIAPEMISPSSPSPEHAPTDPRTLASSPAAAAPDPEAPPPTDQPAARPGLMDALSQASARTRRRTGGS